jgi:hypothetical protein
MYQVWLSHCTLLINWSCFMVLNVGHFVFERRKRNCDYLEIKKSRYIFINLCWNYHVIMHVLQTCRNKCRIFSCKMLTTCNIILTRVNFIIIYWVFTLNEIQTHCIFTTSLIYMLLYFTLMIIGFPNFYFDQAPRIPYGYLGIVFTNFLKRIGMNRCISIFIGQATLIFIHHSGCRSFFIP